VCHFVTYLSVNMFHITTTQHYTNTIIKLFLYFSMLHKHTLSLLVATPGHCDSRRIHSCFMFCNPFCKSNQRVGFLCSKMTSCIGSWLLFLCDISWMKQFMIPAVGLCWILPPCCIVREGPCVVCDVLFWVRSYVILTSLLGQKLHYIDFCWRGNRCCHLILFNTIGLNYLWESW
jgi:hypothetical protein